MEHLCVRLEDLPDEILLIIFQKLNNCDVLYSFMGLNQRLDTILYDRIFTRNLSLIKYIHKSSYQFNIIIDRFCLEILPKINDKIERLCIESSFIKRILLATNYPNLHALDLYECEPETADTLFYDGSYLVNQFQNQISSIFIKLKPHKQQIDKLRYTTQDNNIFIFIRICILFNNLRYLNFSSYSNYEQLIFLSTAPTQFSSNLLELHVVVRNILDCLCILDGQFNQLHTFYVTIQSYNTYDGNIVGNYKELPKLKYFSLIYEDGTYMYDDILVPLLQRMINLEELNLYFINMYGPIIDGYNLENNIINHMTRLNKFTFNICSVIHLNQLINNVPMNEDIKYSFRNFKNNKIISNIDYFERIKLFYYHVYSYPYIWKFYHNITNNFHDGLYKSVREISLYDDRPFEHEFFLRITQSFPFVKKLTIHNYESQHNNHLRQSIIKYFHLIEIDLVKTHEDYLDEFLNKTKICLSNNIHLRVGFNSLQKVTNDFTRDETRFNSSKIIHLTVFGKRNNHYFIAKYVIIHLLSCSLALVPSNFNDNIIKLSEQVKQGYSREELLRKLNSLEESIHDRNRQLNRANEPRREFDRIISKLSQWIKTTEQQIKDPLTNHLQQTTNSLKEKYKSIQALLQSTKDRTNLFDDLRQKYNRLLDNLTQRLTLLDEANQQFKQLLKRLNQTNNNLKELRRLQRLLTSKGHRIDFRRGGQLNANFKNLQGKIHNEIERIERVLQRENDFYHLEKELESYLQISSEHFKSGQYQQDKRIDYQAIFDRLQQNEQGLNKLIQLAERLKPELSQYLQTLIKTCQQARGEHEHKVKTQNKLNEELIPINDCFKRLIQELTQPIDLYLSLNYLNHIQDSMAQLNVSIDQRLLRLDQALRDQPNLISSNDKEIRERLNTVEELKHQVKNHLNKRRTILDDIHQRMTQYLKLTADIKTAILYEYSKSFNSVDKLFCYFLLFFSDADFKLAPFFHGYYQTRIHQRRKELDEIRQKSNRFNSSLIRLQSDTDRLLHTIEKAPDSAETLISEIDSTFSALQYLGGDLKKSLDISSSSDIDRELKDMASPVETIRDSLDRAKRSYEENETIRDRIEKILNKVKTFTNRKRQELH
ncbi:unnamed protein product [Rotaria sordida]|uniref:F-box domain-containing protein n=2 Tax=Rotaria sordida TaxID=392033 RepID=A0A818K4T5_9BILA|nr:unnamed protein product [Rotaria sordida]CAF3549578.1 unnamed protein product [Rotaria sordida]